MSHSGRSKGFHIILDVVRRLGFEETKGPTVQDKKFLLISKEECIETGASSGIRIGSGIGYSDLVVEFYFDANDELISHGVW